MGRELYRVPLNFNWPVDTTWEGYLNPHYKGNCIPCAECAGTGESPASRMLKENWYGNAPFQPEDNGSTPFSPSEPAILSIAQRNVSHSPEFYRAGSTPGQTEDAIARESRRLCRLFNKSMSHHLSEEDVSVLLTEGRLSDITTSLGRTPTAAEVNTWSLSGFGHDSVNAWLVMKARCEKAGEPLDCPVCKGEGESWVSAEAKAQCEAWSPVRPPEGEGYQMWQTVSEGGPISPVFAKAEELAQWLEENPWGADRGTTAQQWLAFIHGPGWAPSLVVLNGEASTGVNAS